MSESFRVIITPRAGADLEKIHDFIAQDSAENASGMIRRILDALESIKIFPHRTVKESRRPDLRHPARSIVVKPYVVYFRVLDNEKVIRVLHVRHGARQKPSDLG